MISWKYSFEKINKDLELARKKKQALDNLFNSGKISASTHGSLNTELTTIISDIEMRQKILANNLASKVEALEKQIGTLEIFLANSEIQYVAGEIDEELHANESSAFSSGLRSLKEQLIFLKEAVASLMPEVTAPMPAPVEAESLQLSEVVFEETAEISVEDTIEAPVGVPVMDAVGAPVEVPFEAPIEATVEMPVEMPAEVPVEAPVEEAVEEAFAPYVEVPVEEETIESADVPAEVPVEAPVEAVVETTLEVSVEVP